MHHSDSFSFSFLFYQKNKMMMMNSFIVLRFIAIKFNIIVSKKMQTKKTKNFF